MRQIQTRGVPCPLILDGYVYPSDEKFIVHCTHYPCSYMTGGFLDAGRGAAVGLGGAGALERLVGVGLQGRAADVGGRGCHAPALEDASDGGSGGGGRGERGSCSAHVRIKDLQCYRRLFVVLLQRSRQPPLAAKLSVKVHTTHSQHVGLDC